MFNLYEILRNAQGGHALDNLVTQFDITAEEADAAVKAVVPALSAGFLKQASEPHVFGSFIGAMGEDQHLAAFTDPAAAQATATAPMGGDILSQILGSQQRSRGDRPAGFERDRHQPGHTGKNAPGHRFDDLRRPCEIHGKSVVWRDPRATRQRRRTRRSWPHSRPDFGRQSGFGNPQPHPIPVPAPAGRQGGLGSILGQILGGGRAGTGPGQPAPSAPGPAGALGGILGSILGSLTRRPSAAPGTGPAAEPAAPSSVPQMPGFDAASIQASLEALTKMLQPGTPPPASMQPDTPLSTDKQTDVSAEIDRIMGGKRD